MDHRKKDENIAGAHERQARNMRDMVSDTDDVTGSPAAGRMGLDRRDDVDDDDDGLRGGEDGMGSEWTAGRGYVTGLYDSPESADRAYQQLTERHGYKPGDINVLMTDETRQRHFGDVKPGTEFKAGTRAAETGGKGAAIGGGIGAALAAIFAVGSNVVVPGLGLVIAGPIAGALAGAGAGAATGGVVGALIGAGIPKERAEAYDRGLRNGGVVLGTRARDERHAEQLEREFGEYGGTDVMR